METIRYADFQRNHFPSAKNALRMQSIKKSIRLKNGFPKKDGRKDIFL